MGCGSSVQPPLDPITDVQPPEVAEAEAKAPAGPPAELQASGDTPLPTMQNFGPRPGNGELICVLVKATALTHGSQPVWRVTAPS